MIEEIRIKNLKSMKDIDLSLSNLYILAGLNGNRKSSFIQSLLVLRQSFTNTTKNIGLILKGELINLGSGKDVFYQYAGKDEYITFEIKTEVDTSMWQFIYSPDSDILALKK